jgi:hypothetical protein
MENINNKIKAYAKSKGVDTVDFQSDVILVKPSDADVGIEQWNLDISEPTTDELNALSAEATELETSETDAVAQKATDKTNANSKLEALGLTADEVASISK